MDFVWNEEQAEQVRRDCTQAMSLQTGNMARTAAEYVRIAERLDDEAREQDRIAETAMRWVTRWISDENRAVAHQEPDWDARELARLRAQALRGQAEDLRDGDRVLRRAIEELRDARDATNRLFEQMRDEAQTQDTFHAQGVDAITNDIVAFSRKLEHVFGSFDNRNPVVSMINSINTPEHTTTNEILDALMAAAMTGFPVFTVFAGDPVNMATGNFVYTKEDMKIPGRYPLAFERFYNTIGARKSGVLGSNWTHSYDIRLTAGEKAVSIDFGDGHTETYTKLNDEYYISSLGTGKAVAKTDDGWELCSIEMETHLFDKEGFLLCVADINGGRIDFSYENKLLAGVSTPSGHLLFIYNTENHLTAVSDSIGRKLQFEYTDGRLTKIIYPTGAIYTYTYDTNGRLSELFTPLGTRETKSEFDENGRVVKQYLSDGGVLKYRYDGRSATFIRQDEGRISYKRDDKYRITEVVYPDGSEKFEYDGNNQKTLTVDKLGNETQYTYNRGGKLSNIVDSLKGKTELNYNPSNQLSGLIVNGQKKFQNEYDDAGNIVAIKDALQHETKLNYVEKGIPETIIQADGSCVQFTYDERKNISKIVDAFGVSTEYRYDGLNRIIATVDGNGNETGYQYDAAGNIIEVKNAIGDIRSYAYNLSNKVTKIVDFNGSLVHREYTVFNKVSKHTDQLGRETSFGYDSMWNLAQILAPNGAETKFVYNKQNQLETIEKPDKSTISYQYDANGNRTRITDELGNRTRLKYDALKRLTEVTGPEGLRLQYTYNAESQLTSATDAMGNTVELTYDAAGQLIQETNAVGGSRRYTYTPLGKISSATDEAGRITRYEYEPGGRICAVNYPDDTKETFNYDKGGNIQSVTGRIGQTQTYEYDRLNRVVKISNSTGAVKRYTYDAVSNVTSMTDESGNVTNYEYTLTGKLSKVTDALGNEASYAYDECDRVIEIRQSAAGMGLDEELQNVSNQNAENKQLHIMRYERNMMGQVEAITDALGNKENYRYDVRGQLIEKLDKDGYLTKYGYTAHGNVNNIQYADGREVKLSYNSLRQLTEIEDWLGKTNIEVDALGRATKVTNHQDKAVSYTWGATGLKMGMEYPDGKHVGYVYDELLRLNEVTDGINIVNYHYDTYSRLSEKIFSDGTKTAYTYNDLGRLQGLQHANAESVLDCYEYSYDIAGNKTKIVRNRNDMPEESGTYSYTYDALNRLNEVLKDNQLLRSYEYDGYGNRAAMTEGGNRTSYTYNEMNQLILSADTAGNEQKYTYDKRGNLTEIFKNGIQTNRYQFGALNRLEQAINHETGLNSEYRYNGLGHRVGHSIGESDLNPTKHIDDVLDLTRNFNNLLERCDDNSATTYMWDTSLLSAMGDNGTNKNYLLDEMGGPARVIGADGIAEAYCYDEFGNTQRGTSDIMQPFGFTGYQHDAITETWFAQSREYDAQTGRFTAKDLNRHMNHGVVQSLNLYQYCYGNPVRYVDPLGFDLFERMEELFPESNFNQNTDTNDPIQISINGNVITLDVFVNIQGDINATIDDHCVVDLAIQGIATWGGTHVGPFGQIVAIEVNVHQGSKSWWSWLPWISNQNFMEVNITDGAGVANLTTSGDWSPTNPGVVNLYTHRSEAVGGARRTSWHYVNTSAHEFGHAFGVNDANREWRNDALRAQGLEDRYLNRPAADMLDNINREVMGYGILNENMYISRHSVQMMIYAMLSGDRQRFMEYERGPQSSALNASIQKD